VLTDRRIEVCRSFKSDFTSKGLTSRPKLKTWVYLLLCLARPLVHLRWLAMTCAHFGRDQICMQVDASFSPFGHPTQVNASWVASIRCYSNLLANEIQDMSALKWVFLRLACTCEETCESVWPSNISFYACASCGYLRLPASPFGPGLIVSVNAKAITGLHHEGYLKPLSKLHEPFKQGRFERIFKHH